MDGKRYVNNQHLNILDECILVLDQSGMILSANDFACAMFEAGREQIEGVAVKSLMNIDVNDAYIEQWMEAKIGEVEYHTYEFVSLMGRRFLGNMKLIRTAPEMGASFFCRISDAVLDTGGMSEAFPKQAVIKRIIDERLGVVFVKNTSGRYIYANEVFYHRCSKGIDSVVNLSDDAIFSADDAALFTSTDNEVIASGKVSSYYHWNDDENPERIFYQTIKYPIFDLKDKTIGILGLSFDITQGRSFVDEVLQNPHKSISISISNSKRIGYVLHELLCDTDGRPIDYVFLDMNRTFEELTGLKYQEVVGKRVLEVLPDTEKQWIDFYGNVALSGVSRSFENYSKELGKTYSVEAFQTDPGFFCVLVQDITIMKDTEQQLIALYEEADVANRAKEHFLMNMSHEIRTPLNGINGILELLSNTKMDDGQKQYLEILNASFKSLSTVLTEIIDYTHMTRSMVQLVDESFDLKVLMDEISDLFAASAIQKGLNFEIKYMECHTPFFVGDRIKLKQLLSNIIGNAIKFTMFGSVQVEIGCNEDVNESDSVAIRITDTGIGMDENDKKMLFRLFNQKSEGFNKLFNGLGLGLAISSEICKTLGATIEIDSEIGKGTIVELSVPLRRELSSEHSSQSCSNGTSSSSTASRVERIAADEQTPFRVLVVEDDPVSGMFLELMLQNEGYDVRIAMDGKEALKVLEGERIDIVLMDINLPGLDGFETTRILRSMKPETTKIPVIAITGYVTEDNRKRSNEVGMADFLPKPIGKTDLINSLTKWL